MVDLTKKPFYLSETDISWVEETIRSMSPEEKIGQLFIMLDRKKDREETKKIFSRFHIGGCRYSNEPAEQIYEQNRFYQENSKIPLLIACNCDSGGAVPARTGRISPRQLPAVLQMMRKLPTIPAMSADRKGRQWAATGILVRSVTSFITGATPLSTQGHMEVIRWKWQGMQKPISAG